MIHWTRWDGNPNPETPAFSSTHDWIKYYLAVHQLSGEHASYLLIASCYYPSNSIGSVTYAVSLLYLAPSYRYAYLLWFAIVALVLLFGFLGHASGGSTHTAISAFWHKWSIRRPSLFALVKRQPLTRVRSNTNTPPPPRKTRTPAWWKIKFSPSPVLGELLALSLLAVAIVLASVLGPDYLKPSIATFDFTRNNKREWSRGEADVQTSVSPRGYTIVVNPPTYTIQKAWWTAGGRTGESS